MKKFYLKASGIALLLCLGAQNSFSMEEKEPDASALPQRALNTYQYDTFENGYSDLLEKRFPTLVKAATTSKARLLNKEMTLGSFVTFIKGCLAKLEAPLKMSFKNGTEFVLFEAPFLTDGDLTLGSLVDERNVPITRQEKEFQESKNAAIKRYHLGDRRMESIEGIDVQCILELAEGICNTRVNLLTLMRDVTTDIHEKERLYIASIHTYNVFYNYLESLERRVGSGASFFQILQKKINIVDLMNPHTHGLQLFYNAQKRMQDFEKSSKILRIYTERLLKNKTVMYLTLREDESHAEFREGFKTTIIEGWCELVETCLSEASNASFRKDSAAVKGVLEQAEKYTRKIIELDSSSPIARKKSQQIGGLKEKIAKEERASLLHVPKHYKGNPLEAEILKDTIYPKHQALIVKLTDVLQDKERTFNLEIYENLSREINQFERDVLGREGQEFLSLEQVHQFYEKYKVELQENASQLLYASQVFVRTFMAANQFNSALAHISAFKSTYQGIDKEKFFAEFNRHQAIIKALQGDPREILEIEFARLSLQDQRAKEKAEDKKKAQEAIVRAAKASMEKSAKEQEEKKQKEADDVKKEARQTRAPSSPPRAASDVASSFTEPALSAEAEKKLKLGRHEARMSAQKAESQAAEVASFREMPAAGAAMEHEEGLNEIDPERATYFLFDADVQENLTTLQRRLEREMETNSWNFTREELQAYYEGFGCKIRQRGSHVTAALPKFEVVELPNGEPLVVNFNFEEFNLEGGSFVFAKWTHTVPQYLRLQIFEARRRIQAFKCVVNEEVRRTLSGAKKDQ
ncbi:MAG: hypothetical protein JSS34_03080 [Proteobacteria bacterium]|nr:hypothetical protein [Pseudomonadota bacterium]